MSIHHGAPTAPWNPRIKIAGPDFRLLQNTRGRDDHSRTERVAMAGHVALHTRATTGDPVRHEIGVAGVTGGLLGDDAQADIIQTWFRRRDRRARGDSVSLADLRRGRYRRGRGGGGPGRACRHSRARSPGDVGGHAGGGRAGRGAPSWTTPCSWSNDTDSVPTKRRQIIGLIPSSRTLSCRIAPGGAAGFMDSMTATTRYPVVPSRLTPRILMLPMVSPDAMPTPSAFTPTAGRSSGPFRAHPRAYKVQSAVAAGSTGLPPSETSHPCSRTK